MTYYWWCDLFSSLFHLIGDCMFKRLINCYTFNINSINAIMMSPFIYSRSFTSGR